MDSTDRALLAALQLDARASITTLAHDLDVSRATVQTRLEKLRASGTIRRFTIELGAEGQPERIRAITLIALQGAVKRTVARALHRIPEIRRLHSTNGAWDLVAEIETDTLPGFDKALNRVRDLQGVRDSETCLLLDEV